MAPTPFGAGGLFGGGERYPMQLAQQLAGRVQCRLLTFGKPARRRLGELEVWTLPARMHWKGHPAHPLAPGMVAGLSGADLVHCHHLRAAPTRAAALWGAITGTPVVVTDHGLAGGDWAGLLPGWWIASSPCRSTPPASSALPPAAPG